jgi:hypothetical protein
MAISKEEFNHPIVIAQMGRPGELARAALRLGDANININYGYAGIDPGTNAP